MRVAVRRIEGQGRAGQRARHSGLGSLGAWRARFDPELSVLLQGLRHWSAFRFEQVAESISAVLSQCHGRTVPVTREVLRLTDMPEKTPLELAADGGWGGPAMRSGAGPHVRT